MRRTAAPPPAGQWAKRIRRVRCWAAATAGALAVVATPTVASADPTTNAVTVTSVSPNSGPTSGGTPVTVRGSGFKSVDCGGATSFQGTVYFAARGGAGPFLSVQPNVIDDSTLTVVSPKGTGEGPGASGPVDVLVSCTSMRSPVVPEDKFTYLIADRAPIANDPPLPTLPAGQQTQPTPLYGWDTYRHLDRAAELPLGVATRQFSSFDRTEGNDDGFSGAYSCLDTSTTSGCLIAEHHGPGEVEDMFFTKDGNPDITPIGNIRIEVDGRVVVNALLQDVVNGKLGAPFVYPLVANSAQSSDGNYIRVPIPFQRSLRIYTQNNVGFYHVTYRTFDDPTGVPTFDPTDRAQDVLTTLAAAGTRDPKPALSGTSTVVQPISIPAGGRAAMASPTGPGTVTELKVHLPVLHAGPQKKPASADPREVLAVAASDDVLRNTRLRITFDGTRTVDSPLGEFFGSGLGAANVKSLMFAMNDTTKDLITWWPMPYDRSAVFELVNNSGTSIDGASISMTTSTNRVAGGTFHTSSAGAATTPNVDWPLLLANGHGKLSGVVQSFQGTITQGYLEGDEHIYVDGSPSPQLHGTGTEDFYEGAAYWAFGPFTAPFNGNTLHRAAANPLTPTADTPDYGCQSDCEGAYRLLMSDAIAFTSGVQAGIEHGSGNAEQATYGSTAFWYGESCSCTNRSDELVVGDPASRAAHSYTSDPSSTSMPLTATYEGDTPHQKMVTATVESSHAPVAFTMAVPAGAAFARLSRSSDQAARFQSAVVTVDGQYAGIWVQPLANGSFRWLDDTFVLPPALTRGKTMLRIGLAPLGGNYPAWTAASYRLGALGADLGAPTADLPETGHPAVLVVLPAGFLLGLVGLRRRRAAG